MFGPGGQNKEGKCYKRHPYPCQNFAAGKCNDKNCVYMHAAPVCTFFLKGKCQRNHCKFTHKKETLDHKPRDNNNGGNTENPTYAKVVTNGQDSFLDQFMKLTKRLEERMDQMEQKMVKGNNNNSPFSV